MLKHEFASAFGISESDVERLIKLSREAQSLGLSAEPEIGLLFLTEMDAGCITRDIFFVVDNNLYDQHMDESSMHSPLGDQIYVPDWDTAYAWAAECGWQLETAVHNESGILVTLSNGEEQATGQANSGRVAMLEAAVCAKRKSKGIEIGSN